jgi:hypothetical protein
MRIQTQHITHYMHAVHVHCTFEGATAVYRVLDDHSVRSTTICRFKYARNAVCVMFRREQLHTQRGFMATYSMLHANRKDDKSPS